MGFLWAFLSTPFGLHQVCKDIYGGVVDHINESHISTILVPAVSPEGQKAIGKLVRAAFDKKDRANALESEAIAQVEAVVRERQ
jgi:type I restriction enzyme S subunit